MVSLQKFLFEELPLKIFWTFRSFSLAILLAIWSLLRWKKKIKARRNELSITFLAMIPKNHANKGKEHCAKRARIRSYSGPHFYRIFPHLDWMQRDMEYLSVFIPNAGKCGKNALRLAAQKTHGIETRNDHDKKQKWRSASVMRRIRFLFWRVWQK